MADKEKKTGRQKYKNVNISRTKMAFYMKKHFSKFWRGYNTDADPKNTILIKSVQNIFPIYIYIFPIFKLLS